MMGICSHTIAVTIRFGKEANGAYTEDYLDQLLEKLSDKKRASHRPKKTLGGAHIQPHGDSDDDGEQEEEEGAYDFDYDDF